MASRILHVLNLASVQTAASVMSSLRMSKKLPIVEIAILSAFSALLLSLASVFFYVLYVPGETRELSGNIISFETQASARNIRVVHLLHVRLDSGLTVSARVAPHVPVKVGRRVNLVATRMPIIGIERFRFKEFLDPPPNQNPLSQK